MGKDAGQREHQHPPWWCWSQLVCPGEGWAVWEGDSGSSTTGGLVLSCPTGGGHGRSLITLISTASVAQVVRGEMEGRRGRQQEAQMDNDKGSEEGEVMTGNIEEKREQEEGVSEK